MSVRLETEGVGESGEADGQEGTTRRWSLHNYLFGRKDVLLHELLHPRENFPASPALCKELAFSVSLSWSSAESSGQKKKKRL